MAYTLNKTLSFLGLRSYLVQAVAGLEAAGFAELAAPWRTQKQLVAGAIEAQAADEDHEAETTARVRFCDTAWEQAVKELSRKAFFLAGGNSKVDPFAALFGTAKVKDLQKLGPAKAVVAADLLAAKLSALAHPGLAEEAQGLAAHTAALATAAEANAAAALKVSSHSIARLRMLRHVEALIAETEARILALHPGRNDLVRSILSPNLGRRSTRKAKTDESPAKPPPEQPQSEGSDAAVAAEPPPAAD